MSTNEKIQLSKVRKSISEEVILELRSIGRVKINKLKVRGTVSQA